MSNAATPAAGKARRGAQVSASSEVGDVADRPSARGGGTGRRRPERGRARARVSPGVPHGCGTPRGVSRAEVARIRGRRATPAFAREKAGTTRPNASFFAFRARGVGAGARCRGRARSWPSRVDAPFRFRASGEHVPYGLVLFLRVEGRGRHNVTDRAKRRDARPEFSRVRSDSLPAGQPSWVRWGPGAPPLQELRTTGREPSRERADAVRGRPLRRPRFPGRRCVGESLSAKERPRTDPYAPQSSNLQQQGHILPFFKTRHHTIWYTLLDVEEKRLEQNTRCWVFLATLASAP